MAFADDVKSVITARSPSTTQDSRLEALIVLAGEQLSEACFGAKYAYAAALLCLHWLAMDERGSAAVPGAIVSEKEDTLERRYGSSSGTASSDYWDSTHWGTELKKLKKRLIFAPRNRMMNAC